MTRSKPQHEENRMGTVPIPKLMISMGAPIWRITPLRMTAMRSDMVMASSWS